MCSPLHGSIILRNIQSSKGFQREQTWILAQDQLFPDRMNDTDLALIGIVIASCIKKERKKQRRWMKGWYKERCVYSNETIVDGVACQ